MHIRAGGRFSDRSGTKRKSAGWITADEVIAHELGHCIVFRPTDYMNRSSCGQNANEGTAEAGAIHIPGTPTVVSGNYKSWMMACTDGSPNFSSSDGVALQYVY